MTYVDGDVRLASSMKGPRWNVKHLTCCTCPFDSRVGFWIVYCREALADILTIHNILGDDSENVRGSE